MKAKYLSIMCLASALLAASCTKQAQDSAKLVISDLSVEVNSVTFSLTHENLTSCAYVLSPAASSSARPDAETVLKEGTPIDASSLAAPASTHTVSGLEFKTDYVLSVAGSSASGDKIVREYFTSAEDPHPSTYLDGPANCYIVPKAGTYSFPAKKVSGEQIEGIEKVDWLWTTKSTSASEQAYLSDIAYEYGRVRFTASGKKGNALIAAFDKDGKIVWSWHIWMTDAPKTVTHPGGAVFMDRSLGQWSAEKYDGDDPTVLYYQWGRKDPIFAVARTEPSKYIFYYAKSGTSINPDYSYTWAFEDKAASIKMATQEPMHMFHAERHDWINETNDALWAVNKTDYDPCPAGYRVPSESELEDLKSVKASDFDDWDGGFEFSGAWWPGVGDRNCVSGALELYQCVFSWSCSARVSDSDSSLHYGRRLCASVDQLYADIIDGNKGFAHPVRCVKIK